MLVLSRQRDESIMIGDDVEITIVDVRGDKVRLGITAPKQIPVHRREIYDAIQREKAQKEGEAPVSESDSATEETKEHQQH
jgi:carbon storage regulator